MTKVLKRPGEDLQKPASKTGRKTTSTSSGVNARGFPTTGGKGPEAMATLSGNSEKNKRKPDAPEASEGGEPPKAAGGAAAAGEEPAKEGSKGKIQIPWPLDFMRVKTMTDPSGGSVSSRQRMNAKYAASLSPSPSYTADATSAPSSAPDLAGFGKRMVRTLTQTEKNSIPNRHEVDFDHILGQLAEVSGAGTFSIPCSSISLYFLLFLQKFAKCLFSRMTLIRLWSGWMDSGCPSGRNKKR